MSRTNHTLDRSSTDERTPRRRDLMYASVALFAGVAVVAGVFLGSGRAGNVEVGAAPAAASSEVVERGGLVVEGARIDLGTVPLDVTVTPTWTITNTSSEVVQLGEPHASVVEGCCPGPLTLSDATLEPGESSMMAFPLQMHAGMDGPHDFDVHVPFGESDDYLTLKVVGNFTG